MPGIDLRIDPLNLPLLRAAIVYHVGEGSIDECIVLARFNQRASHCRRSSENINLSEGDRISAGSTLFLPIVIV